MKRLSYSLLVLALAGSGVSCAAKFRAVKSDKNPQGAVGGQNQEQRNEGEQKPAEELPGGQGSTQKDEFKTVQQTFDNGVSGNSEYSFALSNGFFSHELTLNDKISNISKTFDQITRAGKSDMFTQGSSGQARTDTYTQVANAGILDLLIVMDNSGSMAQEQQAMSERMAPLLQHLTHANWRIGVVTTDVSSGCMRAVITKGDANAETTFANAMKAGSGGSGTERGIEQAYKALGCVNNAWLRSKSTVAILFVTDEDNCSTGSSACGSSYFYTPANLKNYLQTHLGRTPGVDARVYGLFWQPGTTCSTGYNQGDDYAWLVSQTSGMSGSICASDYSPVLSKISQNIATILKTQFELSHVPDANSVSVTVNNQPWPASGYSVSGKTITFSTIPPEGASIKVSYKTGSQIQLSAFILSETPAAGSVSVKINGQPFAASGYTVNNKTLQFSAPPPASSTILVEYLSGAVALSKEFDVGANGVAGSIKVYVNGQEMASGWSYNASNGKLVFASAPADGAKIKVDLAQNQGPNLNYPFSPIGANVRDFSAVDKATNAAVAATLVNNNEIVIPIGEFQKGRVILVRYRSEESQKMSIELPHDPIDDSLKVEEGPEGCGLGGGIVQNGKVLDINCNVPDNTLVRVSYRYLLPPLTEYIIDNVKHPEQGKWEVRVNDELVTNYRREGNKIIFEPNVLPIGARVFIKYSREGVEE